MMDWIKNNIFNIAITLITIALGIGAIYASLQLRNTSTETELTKSAKVQEVCRTIFTLKLKPTPTPTPLFSNSFESTDSAVMQDISITPFDLTPPIATNTPTLNPPPTY